MRWKLENARYCRRWRWSHAHCRRLALAPQTHPPVRKPNPKLNQRPLLALFCLKLDNSCYARYSCGNNCNVFVKLVQEYHCFNTFSSVPRKQFAVNDMFLGEANSYKRALALRNSRQYVQITFLNATAHLIAIVQIRNSSTPMYIYYAIQCEPGQLRATASKCSDYSSFKLLK